MNFGHIHAFLAEPTRRKRFLRFCIAGLGTAAFYMTGAGVLAGSFGLAPALAGAVAFALALPVNYGLHKLWSFQSRRLHREAVPRFVLVIALGLSMNSIVIWFAVETLHLHYLLAQFAGLAVVAVWNYLTFENWVFRKVHVLANRD